MSCGSTACCTPVTILAIQIHEKDQQQRLNKTSCIDLSRKRKCDFIRCCNFHISFEVIMCHEFAESNENEDIVLHNYEMGTTHYSETRLCVCEACLFHTDKLHDFKGVSDSVCVIMCHEVVESKENEDIVLHNYEMGTTHYSETRLCVCEACLFHTDKLHDFIGVSGSVCIFHALLKTSNGGQFLHQKKVVGGKERRRGSMEAESRNTQHKITHYSLIGESTLQHDRKRHTKKSCLVKCYSIFTFKMFLVAFINLRIPLKAPKTSNGKGCIDGEVLPLIICVKTKKLLQFYLCESDVCNGKAKTVLHSRTNQNMIYIREMAKASFGEDFEEVPHNELSVPQCDAIGDNLLCSCERRPVIAPHNGLSRDHSVETDKNVLHNDLPGDHSVETDKNVLHNDLSGDSSVETDKNVLHNYLSVESSVKTDNNVLHNDLSGDHSVETDKKVLHNDLPEDHSVETDKNVLHNNLSGDSSVETDKKVLHNDLPEDHSVETDKNVLHNDLSGDSSVETDKNVLHNDLPGDPSVETDKNVLHNDLPGDHSVETDKNVLHNDVSGNNSFETVTNVLDNDLLGDIFIEVDKNVLHNDLSGDHSVEIDKNVLHNDLSVESSVKTDNNVLCNDLSEVGSVEVDKNVLHKDLSGDSSVEVDINVLYNNLSEVGSVEVDKNVLHKDLSEDSSVEVDKIVLHKDLSEDSSVEVYINALHNDLSEVGSVEVDKNVLHKDLSGDSSVEVDKNVLHKDLSEESSVEVYINVLHTDLSEDSSVEVDINVLHKDLSEDSSVEVDINVLHNDLSEVGSVEVDKNVLHNDLSVESSVKTDNNVLHNDLSEDSSVEVDKNVLHKNLSEDSSVEADKNVLHDLSEDSSVEVDKNVLHKDLSEDSSVEVYINALHNDLSEVSSVEVDKNVLHKDLSGDSSVEVDKNVLHKDLSEDSSVEVYINVLHKDLSEDSSLEVDINVLHKDLSEDSSVEVDINVLHNDLSEVGSVEVDKNVLHNDLSVESSVKTDNNVLHNDLSEDSSVEVDKNVLHKDLSEDSSVEVDKNVLHNDLSEDSSVEVDKNVLHNDLSEDSSVEVDKNVLHKDLSEDSSVEVDKNVLHKDLSEDSSVEVDKNVLHKDLSEDSSVEVYINALHNDLSEVGSVEVDKNVLHKDLSGDSSVEVDKNVLHKDLSEDSSVEVDINVLHNDLSEVGSVEVDKNVLHNDLSVESSVKTDNNVLHNDLSEDSSVEVDKNVLHKDLSEDSSVEVDKNVLHNDLSEDSSVEVDKNVLHNDLSEDSSVEVDKNVLHKDLSEDSSVEVDKNVLHKDLSEDSSVEVYINVLHNDLSEVGSVEVDINVRHNDLSGDSSVEVDKNLLPNDLSADNRVKIYGNDLHYDLLEDISKSFKISKNDFHDVTSEVSSIKTSKPMYNIKLNKNNTHQIKVTDNVDYIRSCMDMLGVLGIYPRCFHNPPIFWQEITLYPFTRHVNNQHGDLHQLMRYEVFRLCSFSYARFPANCDVWVTHLAQAGFYCENENGRIICFHCGREFRGSVGSSVEDGHHPECDYHEHSRPLHVWTEGLNQEVLAIYYNRYGSLRPYNFEVSSQQSLSDHPDSAHGSGPGLDVAEPQPQRYSEQASGDTAVAREPETPVLAEVNREDSVIVEAVRPEYHSMALPSDPGGGSRDHEFGDQAQSLPGNLNEVSGAVVSEESQDTPGSYQILTSAATNPMPFYSSATRGSQSQADDGTEQGAVGGTGVTLDLSKASYPLFSSAEARRQTYTAWSPTHSHRPEDLAAAGFFYAGYADCVRCFCCGLGLKFWRQADIPAYQHARYRPHCVYNRLYKGQDYVDRVQQDLRSEQGITDQLVEALPPAQDALTVATRPRPGRVQDEEAPATGTPLVTEAPRVPDLMNSEVAQTAMRNGWQRHQVQQAVDHIIQEFNVRSLEIGLLLDVLANLNQDEPERNLPSGGSVGSADSGVNDPPGPPSSAAADDVNEVLIGGVSNVQREIDVADAIHGEEAAAQLEPRAVPIQQPSVPPIEFNELFRSVEREHALLSERTTCRVCRRQPVSCIYLPCGHVIACQDCADIATHCILCTRQIIGTANIFLA